MYTAFSILWSVFALLFGTATMSIRLASRTKLIDALKRAGREQALEAYDEHEEDYALATLFCQQFAIVLFMISVGLWALSRALWLPAPIFVFCITAVWVLIVGVAVPAAWARYAGESYIARTLPVLEGLRRLSRPLLVVINTIGEIVRRLAGAPREMPDRSEEMEREILDAVSQAQTSGAVDESERAMIQSVMVLDEQSVGEIMTPRTDMVGVEINADYEQIRDLVLKEGHSRIPVYEDTMDQIVGVVYAKDLLRVDDPPAFSLKEMMREVPFIPETKELVSLLREFQANRIHIAIVLDEYGGTAGLVTIEDILEELVGEITDEHEAPPRPAISRIDALTAEVDARLRVDEVNEELKIALPEHESYDTIGGYVFSKLGRIPGAGESFIVDDVELKVLEAEERCVNRVRIRIIRESSAA